MNGKKSNISFGTICVTVGILALISAAALWLYNDLEDRRAANYSNAMAKDLIEIINNGNPADLGFHGSHRSESAEATLSFLNYDFDDTEDSDEPRAPAYIFIDDTAYIGVLSIPSLSLSLPINNTWSYPALRNTPCRFSGFVEDNNIVLAAHNYTRHFGGISSLEYGDAVIFTDVTGAEIHYYVVAHEVVQPSHTALVMYSQYDLTLFTCNFDGTARVVLRCNRVDVSEQ